MTQVLLNILISFSIYLLISQSFAFIYYPVKFFHLAQAVLITASGYFFFFFNKQIELNHWLSILLSIVSSILLGVLFELFVFKRLRTKKSSALILMIASIGIYVIFQNIISIIWGDDITTIRTGNITVGNEFLGAYITDIQILTIITCLILYALRLFIVKYLKFGRLFRSISSNTELSNVFGINADKIILILFGISAFLAATVGLLVGFDSDLTPTMGFNILLYGVVAMIIGGVGSSWGLIGGALLLSTAQHLGAYYIDSKWMDAIAYVILILFLVWKPLGFSGKRLKKVEI